MIATTYTDENWKSIAEKVTSNWKVFINGQVVGATSDRVFKSINRAAGEN